MSDSEYRSRSSSYSPASRSGSVRNGHSSSRSRSRSISSDRGSNVSGNSSGAESNQSGPGSPASNPSHHSPYANGIRDSKSRSISRSKSRTPFERGSRSRSHSRSVSRSISGSRSRSGSRSQSRSVSRSRSRSGSRSRSRSVSRSRSRSGSRSHSRSVSRSRSRSGSRSRSRSRSRSQSRSVSRSIQGSNRSKSRSPQHESASRSPQLQVNESDKSDGEHSRQRSVTPVGSDQVNGDFDENNLFGDDFDISDDEIDAQATKEPEETEEAPKEEVVPESCIRTEIPKIVSDLGREVHFVKLPNFLSVETRPFDAETYEDELDDEETLDEEGRQRIKLRIENTMRWREVFDKEGNVVRESNTKLVKWSDGSMSLHLGSEIFDIYRQPLQGDHNHLFIRQGTGLQGQAIFRTKLSFRPHSTDSFTHRKITMSMADRSQKNVGVKVLSTVTKDPEVQRNESLRRDEDRLKASQRRESKQKRVREKSSSRGLSRGFIEDDEDGGPSIFAIKQEMKRKAKEASNIYSSDEEDSDIETRPSKRIERAKRGLEDSEDDSDSAKRKKVSDSESEGRTPTSNRSGRSSSRSSGSRSRSRSSSGSSRGSGSSRSGSASRSDSE